MTFEELIQFKVQQISNLKISEKFVNEVFRTCSGGRIKNETSIVPIHDEEYFSYESVGLGKAFEGRMTIECTKTGLIDDNDDNIYVTPTNEVFVYFYMPISNKSFDSGIIKYPKIDFNESQTGLQQLQSKIAILHDELDLFMAGDPRFTWVYFSDKLQQLSNEKKTY